MHSILLINRHPFTRLVSLYVAWGKMKDPVNGIFIYFNFLNIPHMIPADHFLPGKNYGIAASLRKPWEKKENKSPAATPDEYLT